MRRYRQNHLLYVNRNSYIVSNETFEFELHQRLSCDRPLVIFHLVGGTRTIISSESVNITSHECYNGGRASAGRAQHGCLVGGSSERDGASID